MKRTDFAGALYRYFRDYLVNDRGCSARTIETYRYAFIQFIDYMENHLNIRPEKIELTHINVQICNHFSCGWSAKRKYQRLHVTSGSLLLRVSLLF